MPRAARHGGPSRRSRRSPNARQPRASPPPSGPSRRSPHRPRAQLQRAGGGGPRAAPRAACGSRRPSTRSARCGSAWSTRSPISPSSTRSRVSRGRVASTTGSPSRSRTRSAASSGSRSRSSGSIGLARIEETLGPSHRDDLLRSVALALEGTLRQADTLARLGQDDVFSLLLSGIKRDADVIVVAEKLRLALRNPFGIGGHELAVTASIGIALFPEDGPDAETLLQSASVAMLRARARGGDAWDVHAPGSRAAAGRRQARESALRRALAREELELRWQPVVQCDTGAIVGHARAARGRRRALAGRRRSGRARRTRAPWRCPSASGRCARPAVRGAAGSRPATAGSCSRSTCRCASSSTPPSSSSCAVRSTESGLPPEALELEVSEAELARSPEAALERLAELRRLGVRIALDHFGTGESRLAHVHHYPLDTLKIDASVVKDAVGNLPAGGRDRRRGRDRPLAPAAGGRRRRRQRGAARAARPLPVRADAGRSLRTSPRAPPTRSCCSRASDRKPPAGAYSRP